MVSSGLQVLDEFSCSLWLGARILEDLEPPEPICRRGSISIANLQSVSQSVSQSSPVQSSPVQSSPVQSSPVQSVIRRQDNMILAEMLAIKASGPLSGEPRSGACKPYSQSVQFKQLFDDRMF